MHPFRAVGERAHHVVAGVDRHQRIHVDAVEHRVEFAARERGQGEGLGVAQHDHFVPFKHEVDAVVSVGECEQDFVAFVLGRFQPEQGGDFDVAQKIHDVAVRTAERIHQLCQRKGLVLYDVALFVPRFEGVCRCGDEVVQEISLRVVDGIGSFLRAFPALFTRGRIGEGSRLSCGLRSRADDFALFARPGAAFRVVGVSDAVGAQKFAALQRIGDGKPGDRLFGFVVCITPFFLAVEQSAYQLVAVVERACRLHQSRDGHILYDGFHAAASAESEQIAESSRLGAAEHFGVAVFVEHDVARFIRLIISLVAVADEHEQIVIFRIRRQHSHFGRGQHGAHLYGREGIDEEGGNFAEGEIHEPDQHFAVFAREIGSAVFVLFDDVAGRVDDDVALFVENAAVFAVIGAVHRKGDAEIRGQSCGQIGHLLFHQRRDRVEVGEGDGLVGERLGKFLQLADQPHHGFVGVFVRYVIRIVDVFSGEVPDELDPLADGHPGDQIVSDRGDASDRGDDPEQESQDDREEFTPETAFFAPFFVISHNVADLLSRLLFSDDQKFFRSVYFVFADGFRLETIAGGEVCFSAFPFEVPRPAYDLHEIGALRIQLEALRALYKQVAAAFAQFRALYFPLPENEILFGDIRRGAFRYFPQVHDYTLSPFRILLHSIL